MKMDPAAPACPDRMRTFRMAATTDQMVRAVSALSDDDIRHLARSLEFQAILDAGRPEEQQTLEALAALRPRLRSLRPERLGSVERLCWNPLERFLTNSPSVDGSRRWRVPRRLLQRLWQWVEHRDADLIDQCRRRHLVALFDNDREALDMVSNQIVDCGAYHLNNRFDPAWLGLDEAERRVAGFVAQVMKWHRMVMPNVRHFQQVAALRQQRRVDALRLHSNWFTVYELLGDQFDLYLLYLFEMTPEPVDVINAFPFYFETLTEPGGLATDWLMHRVDELATGVARCLAQPPRAQTAAVLLGMVDDVSRLQMLWTRLRRLRIFGPGGALERPVGDLLRQRLPQEHVERLCDSFIDDLHDVLRGEGERRQRARALLAPLSVALPGLLQLVDTQDRGSRASRARFRLGDKVVEEVGRHLRGHILAPESRRQLIPYLEPALIMCQGFGMAEAAHDLAGKLRR